MVENKVPNRKLKHERERRGLSQQRLAELVGTSVENISRWERGITSPQPHFREKLCKLFKMDAAALGLIDQALVTEEADPPREESATEQETLEAPHTTSSLTTSTNFPFTSRSPADRDNTLSYEQKEIAHKEDWGEAPLLRQMYGRDKELDELRRWIIDDRCHVTAILGMGGIGKTSLAIALADHMKNEFAFVFWRSLQNALPFNDFLRDCIKFLSNQERIDVPEDTDGQISLLIEYIRAYHCLLVLENIETILQGGKSTGFYREGFEGYGKLFQRLGETKHESCLLLTSREKPKEIALLEGDLSSVRSRQLKGLGSNDGKAILRDKGLRGKEEVWNALNSHYAGNPLALKLVSQFIKEVFDGDISTFLKGGEILFSDVHDVLDQQFERLSMLEQEILYWLAIERESVSLKEIQEDMISQVVMRILQEAFRSLRRRDFIETSEHGFTLQNVILEYVTDRFVDCVYEELTTGRLKLFESHALIKAQTKDYVRESQSRFILSLLAQRLHAALGNEGIEEAFKSTLSLLRGMYMLRPSYAAGNILNLFIHMQYALRGYDFSHLMVRQAWLQEASLPEVNFTYSNLATCTFIETFGDVLSVAYSPDGEVVAIGTADNEIRLLHMTTGTPLLIFHGHTDWIYTVAFSPDGQLLASGSYDTSIRVWDVNTGQILKILQGHENGIRSVAFSPDGGILASASDDHSVRLWDVHTGQTITVLQGHTSWVRSVAFHSEGKLLASGSDDQSIRIWDVSTGHLLKTVQGHMGAIWSVDFSHDGQTVAGSSDDQNIYLWDLQKEHILRTLHGHTCGVRSIAYSSDGAILASSSDDQSIRLWEVSTGQIVKTLQGHSSWIRTIAFSPDGRTIVSGSGDQSVRLWDVQTGRVLKTLQGHTSGVWSVAFSSDDKTMASSSGSRDVHLWNANTKQILKTLQGHTSGVWSVAFSPDGTILASGSDDQSIRLWEVKTGRTLMILRDHASGIRSVVFSPDGKILASGSEDRSIRLWNVLTGQVLHTLQGHTSWIRSVAFSPDGGVIASGSGDQSIRLWNASTGQLLRISQGHTSWIRSVVFSPDGQIIASGSGDQSIRLWDRKTGQLLKVLQDQSSGIRSVVFNLDGSMLASGHQDQCIRIWDIDTGQVLKRLYGHKSGGVWSLKFDAYGRTLASGSDDGTIKLWDSNTYECLKTFQSAKPYEKMNITHTTGLTEAQKVALIALGAIEEA
jgi:WD40 repeat protein/transcriptional regulator with XRE-family HTH domain